MMVIFINREIKQCVSMLKPPMNKLSIVKASKKQNSLYNDTHKKKQDFKEIL